LPRLVTALALGLCAAPLSAGAQEGPLPGSSWRLVALDGADVTSLVTLSFVEPGSLAGQAPCNRYRASMYGSLPDLVVGPILSTRTTCPAQAEEDRYLALLALMTRAEVVGGILVLSGLDGDLRFTPGP
jgi:heat shock protein HslJ